MWWLKWFRTSVILSDTLWAAPVTAGSPHNSPRLQYPGSLAFLPPHIMFIPPALLALKVPSSRKPSLTIQIRPAPSSPLHGSLLPVLTLSSTPHLPLTGLYLIDSHSIPTQGRKFSSSRDHAFYPPLNPQPIHSTVSCIKATPLFMTDFDLMNFIPKRISML